MRDKSKSNPLLSVMLRLWLVDDSAYLSYVSQVKIESWILATTITTNNAPLQKSHVLNDTGISDNNPTYVTEFTQHFLPASKPSCEPKAESFVSSSGTIT
jgi:hypothetical protein